MVIQTLLMFGGRSVGSESPGSNSGFADYVDVPVVLAFVAGNIN